MKNHPCTPIIIAEAGVNHNGSSEMTRRLVDAAAEAGADYVKFQTFKAESLVTSLGPAAEYQKTNCNALSQLDMLRSLELGFDDFKMLKEYCDKKGIGFLSTPFDAESIDFLSSMGLDYMKTPSGEISNLPYLKNVADTGLPVIMSTGMSRLGDIESALSVFYGKGYTDRDIILLHCNTEYPTPFQDVNLRAMTVLRDTFGLPTGYSDHTKGTEVAIAATALGACVIEKHFTLSRSLPGPDHVASLQPDELAEMVAAIRNVAVAIGSGVKRVTESERKNMAVARKSIVAAREIEAGETFSEENLTVKRPGDGLSPMLWDDILGRKALRKFLPDEQIEI